jgi:hypothetical protein
MIKHNSYWYPETLAMYKSQFKLLHKVIEPLLPVVILNTLDLEECYSVVVNKIEELPAALVRAAGWGVINSFYFKTGFTSEFVPFGGLQYHGEGHEYYFHLEWLKYYLVGDYHMMFSQSNINCFSF